MRMIGSACPRAGVATGAGGVGRQPSFVWVPQVCECMEFGGDVVVPSASVGRFGGSLPKDGTEETHVFDVTAG